MGEGWSTIKKGCTLNENMSLLPQLLLILISHLLVLSQVAADTFVKSIRDGDTINVVHDNKVEHLRLIGIDAPESTPNKRAKERAERSQCEMAAVIHLGLQARNRIAELIPSGTQIRLEFDVEKRDRFGRLLAYVWLPDGRMANLEMVKSGYAYPMTVPPNLRYRATFMAAFEEARIAQRGLWAHDCFAPVGREIEPKESQSNDSLSPLLAPD